MVSSRTGLELEDGSRTEFYGLGLGLEHSVLESIAGQISMTTMHENVGSSKQTLDSFVEKQLLSGGKKWRESIHR